ncbi:MAG: (d)CMP kinase [Firmicutes bacterium]|uniref:Cytidylate kinase n=1 Tax=Candidatus Colimorpha enterica TaxID=3083063 RepID=R6TBG9_9BACT|nr:(d)CMP kinase [Candidatus Colimorpha enterica]MDY2906182.1 (d)CMP kinase [Eubacteriales bacterium]CDC70763.1 cytidylate kinase [Candidatus Colimorpha enterica]
MINIAVDGPAGAGKSYLARQIAKRLGYIYVDTGALYRSVALYMTETGVSPSDAEGVNAALPHVSVSLDYGDDGEQHVFLNGTDVSTEIRKPEISLAASSVSAIPEVRAFLLGIQRDMARTHNVVMDGRDIGTVIMPDAQVKIFLCANEKARAKRRYLELTEKGVVTTLEAVENEMNQRDRNDSTRKIAPAVPAEDAVILDNSDLDREGTVAAALAIIAAKLA